MPPLKLHTNLSEHHGKLLNSLASMEEYGSQRRVLESALEALKEYPKWKKIGEAYQERAKDLDCLYRISGLIGQYDPEIGATLEAIANVIPSSCNHPNLVFGRIAWNDKVFESSNFRETPWKHSFDIKSNGLVAGRLEMFRNAKDPVFVQRELRLFETITKTLGKMIERVAAQNDLKATELRLKDILEKSGDAIFEIDIDGKVTYISETIKDMLGFTSAEIIERNIRDFIPSSFMSKVSELCSKVKKGNIITKVLMEIPTRDNRLTKFRLSLAPVWKKGEVMSIQGIAENVST